MRIDHFVIIIKSIFFSKIKISKPYPFLLTFKSCKLDFMADCLSKENKEIRIRGVILKEENKTVQNPLYIFN